MDGRMNPTKVQTYRDFAAVSEEQLDIAVAAASSELSSDRRCAHNRQNCFPALLHYILSDLEVEGKDHIVAWQLHGRCFIVHDIQRFEKELLPQWFRQTKFASFQRQLNLYGFKRITKGRDKGGYYHELFLRGRQFLAGKIKRTKIKGTGARRPGSPETEPDFYRYPFLPQTPRQSVASIPLPAARSASETLATAVLNTLSVLDQKQTAQRILFAASLGQQVATLQQQRNGQRQAACAALSNLAPSVPAAGLKHSPGDLARALQVQTGPKDLSTLLAMLGNAESIAGNSAQYLKDLQAKKPTG